MRKILASYLNHLVALAVRLRKSNLFVWFHAEQGRKEIDVITVPDKSSVVVRAMWLSCSCAPTSSAFSTCSIYSAKDESWRCLVPRPLCFLYEAMAVRAWNQGYAALCTCLLCTCDWPITVSFQTTKITVVFFFFSVCSSQVHEPKVKVDLTKYLDNQNFWCVPFHPPWFTRA